METMTKEAIQKAFEGVPVKIRFFKQSRYQKARFKPEYVEPEAWIYHAKSQYGYVITGEEWKNETWRNEYFDTIKAEAVN